MLPTARTLASMRELGIGSKRRGARKRPTSGWEALTPSELEVVRLAADRLTNPKIGQRLFVSRRTAQTHLATPSASSTSPRESNLPQRPPSGAASDAWMGTRESGSQDRPNGGVPAECSRRTQPRVASSGTTPDYTRTTQTPPGRSRL
jgi:hypothetical protein